MFIYQHRANIAHTASDHNWLVITTELISFASFGVLFKATEITGNVRTTKFIIKCRATDWAFEHDIQRR